MKGRCNCGSVEIEISGQLPSLYKCFCTLCQKQGGAASNAATIVRRETLNWISADDQIMRWKKSTGFSSDFCKTCGSPVPNLFRDKYYWVPMGLFDSSLSAAIVAHLYLDNKPAWENPPTVAHEFKQGPDSIEQLVALLENG